jgi:ABC-type bacteriocin/lantibiotic exporter with double-glycine peptidase domain
VRLCHYSFVISLLFISCFPDYKHELDAKASCPENRASFLSQLTFWWFNSLAWKGLKRPLVAEDMWKLDKRNQTKHIYRQFERYWQPAIERSKSLEAPKKSLNVTWPLVKSFWRPLLVVFAFKFVASFMTFVNPLILDQLITFMSSDKPNWIGLMYALGMFGSACLESLLNNQYEYLIFLVSMRIRAALILTIYKKSLVLSASGRKDFTTGQIVNLMSVDVQKVIEYVQMVNLIWASTLQIVIGLYFLWLQLNVATLAGIGMMILMMPLNGVITKKLKDCQTQLMKDKDSRTKLLNEVLNGIKVLKLYAWEKPFADKINVFRNKELASLRKLMIVFSVILFVFNSAPFFVSNLFNLQKFDNKCNSLFN